MLINPCIFVPNTKTLFRFYRFVNFKWHILMGSCKEQVLQTFCIFLRRIQTVSSTLMSMYQNWLYNGRAFVMTHDLLQGNIYCRTYKSFDLTRMTHIKRYWILYQSLKWIIWMNVQAIIIKWAVVYGGNKNNTFMTLV